MPLFCSLCFFASTLLIIVTGAAVTDPDCESINAARGSRLVLSCNAVGCHLTQPRWFNMSGGIREEIKSGIDSITGELEVTRSATSVVGGQKYQCMCGSNLKCYEIHIPPKVSIKVDPQTVEVGGDTRVTCYTSEPGFPQPSTITLQYNGSHMRLHDGSPYMLHNLQLDDAGVLRCVVNEVNTQPFESATLNVYEKVHIVSTVNATVSDDQTTAIIGCLINGSESRTLVNFSKDGVQIPVDNHKFTVLRHNQKDNTGFGRYLMVRDLTDSDKGVYMCSVYVNSTRWVLADTGQLLISSQASITVPGDTPKCKYEVELIAMGTTAAILLSIAVAVAVAGWALAVYLWRRHRTLKAKQEEEGCN